jgi:nitrite reductase/ring-hydroxylating ferredoxin subunit
VSDVPKTRVSAGSVSDLDKAKVRLVILERDEFGKPREAVVVRDENGVARAYRNVCRHLPIPLDAGSRNFLKDGALLCSTHGALYRLSDGVCISGPCKGAVLYPLAVEIEGDEVVVIDSHTT